MGSPAGASPRPGGSATAVAPRCRTAGRSTAVAPQRPPSPRSPRPGRTTRASDAVAEVLRDAVAAIGDHHLTGQPLGADLIEQLQGDLPLGLQGPELRGNIRLIESRLVPDPGLRQVQLQGQGVVALGADVVDTDGDLAVGLLAQRPAVLPLDADGELPLLGEAGIVDDEDALGTGEGPGQVLAVGSQDLLFVPGALVEELLEGLLGVLDLQVGRQGDALGHRLDALALAVEEQSLEIDGAPPGLPWPGELISEEVGIVLEAVQDIGGEFRSRGLAHTVKYEQDRGHVRSP